MNATVSDWIQEENLWALMTALSWIGGYNFDGDDWTTIQSGMRKPDELGDHRFDYTLPGQSLIDVEISKEASETVYSIKVSVDQSLADQVSLALAFCQNFTLT